MGQTAADGGFENKKRFRYNISAKYGLLYMVAGKSCKQKIYNMGNVDTVTFEVTDAMGRRQRAVKRLLDVLFAVVGLVVLSPLMIAIALLLKSQRNGPAFFTQERIGQGGRPFTIYKFRTLNGCDGESVLVPKSGGEHSTRLQRFLREHHLDELPQLWNVLRGDMSFVGPRPERKYYIDKIMLAGGRYELIYRMKPGLTSEATLYNGYTDTMEKMLRRLDMDISYLHRRSLWLDFSIVVRTAFSIISGRKF